MTALNSIRVCYMTVMQKGIGTINNISQQSRKLGSHANGHEIIAVRFE